MADENEKPVKKATKSGPKDGSVIIASGEAKEQLSPSLLDTVKDLELTVQDLTATNQKLREQLAAAQLNNSSARDATDHVVINGTVYTDIRIEPANRMFEDVFKKRYCFEDATMVVLNGRHGGK